MMATNATYEVEEVGVYTPKELKKQELVTGEVGFITASIKSISDIKIGDTITHEECSAKVSLPGYKQMKPMVFCGLYPIETSKYIDLREALVKLKLNDASFQYEPETSKALALVLDVVF